jgi:hypothetical protein
MDRRSFLKGVATAASVTVGRLGRKKPVMPTRSSEAKDEHVPSTEAYTLVCSFQHESVDWKAYEDLRTRDGSLIFLSPKRHISLTKSVEATFSEAEKPYMALDIKEIGMSGPDLLADKLLEQGDPDPGRAYLCHRRDGQR